MKNNLIQRLTRLLSWKRMSSFTKLIQETDIFLISYPRSGNTWVRFLLANLLQYVSREPVDFYTIHSIIPDISISQQREVMKYLPPPRIIKSHSLYDVRYPKVIYILRDGRDVTISYYDYLSKQGLFSGSFLEFLQYESIKPCRWHEHVESWLLQNKAGPNILIVRYENLLKDTMQELRRMVKFTGITATEKSLEYAIRNSTFYEMRRIEKTKGRSYGPSKMNFVRRGISGQWEEQFDQASKDAFKSYANSTLLNLGYITSLDW